MTSSNTKPVVLNHLSTLLREDEIVLLDEFTIKELSAFGYDPSRHGQSAWSAGADDHDDRVMALAIACEARRQYVPPDHPGQDLEFERLMESIGYGVPKSHPRRRYQRDSLKQKQGWGQQ